MKFFKLMMQTLVLIVTTLSCQLADSPRGNQGSLQLLLNLPSEAANSTDRMILEETSLAQVILYRSQSTGIILDDQIPTEEQVNQIEALPEDQRISFSATNSGLHVIDSIPTGEWNILIGYFSDGNPQWIGGDSPNLLSYHWEPNYTINTGPNNLSVTLQPNLTGKNLWDLSIPGTSSYSQINPLGDNDTMVVQITGFAQGANLLYNSSASEMEQFDVNFFDTEGNQLVLPLDEESGSWTYQAAASTDILVMTVKYVGTLNDHQQLETRISMDNAPYFSFSIHSYVTLNLNFDGMIMDDMLHTDVILFKDDLNTFDSEGDISSNNISNLVGSNSQGAEYREISLSDVSSGVTIGNLPVGSYEILVGTYTDNTNWLGGGESSAPQSYKWLALDLTSSGEISQTLTLIPNINSGTFMEYTATSGIAYFPWSYSVTKPYTMLHLTNLTANQEISINDPSGIVEDVNDVRFFNAAGEIDASQIPYDPQKGWSYTPPELGIHNFITVVIYPDGDTYSYFDLEFDSSNSQISLSDATSVHNQTLNLPDGLFYDNGSQDLDMFFIPRDRVTGLIEDTLPTSVQISQITLDTETQDYGIKGYGDYPDGSQTTELTLGEWTLIAGAFDQASSDMDGNGDWSVGPYAFDVMHFTVTDDTSITPRLIYNPQRAASLQIPENMSYNNPSTPMDDNIFDLGQLSNWSSQDYLLSSGINHLFVIPITRSTNSISSFLLQTPNGINIYNEQGFMQSTSAAPVPANLTLTNPPGAGEVIYLIYSTSPLDNSALTFDLSGVTDTFIITEETEAQPEF